MIKNRKDKITTWAFLTPTFIFLGITALIPLVYSLYLSFHRVKLNIPGSAPTFVGFYNYLKMFNDFLFQQSVINTVIFAIVTVVFEMLLGLVIAMLLSSDSAWSRLLRALFLVPMIMAPVASGTLWRMMLDRTTGLVNYLLSLVGIPSISWLGNSSTALMSVMFVDIWRLTPWVTIIIVSALKAISMTTLEAAIVDGATPWKIFTKIIFPLLKPVMIIILMIRLIDAFKVFDTVYVMTGGGPGMATEMLPNYIYNQGLKYFNAGYAASLAWMFIIAMTILTLFFVIIRMKDMNN